MGKADIGLENLKANQNGWALSADFTGISFSI